MHERAQHGTASHSSYRAGQLSGSGVDWGGGSLSHALPPAEADRRAVTGQGVEAPVVVEVVDQMVDLDETLEADAAEEELGRIIEVLDANGDGVLDVTELRSAFERADEGGGGL